MKTKFAVLGAGNGGQALAAHLALRGFDVSLYDRFDQPIAQVHEKGGIRLLGAVEGFAQIRCATTDIAQAVEGRRVLIVVVPAFAHGYVVEIVAPHLVDGQLLILAPGSTGGALEARRILESLQVTSRVVVAETESLPYACRLIASAEVKINAVKKRLAVAALPVAGTATLLEVLQEAFPQLVPAPNVLYTSLHNANAVVHPALTLLNMSYCEQMAGAFDFYRQSAMPSAVRLVERVDGERIAVTAGFDLRAEGFTQWVDRVYGIRGQSCFETFQILAEQVYAGIQGPAGPQARYIAEDVPMGLVPMACLGRLAGVQTPVMHLVIAMASFLASADFWQEGRSLDRLGLSGMTVKEVLAYVQNG